MSRTYNNYVYVVFKYRPALPAWVAFRDGHFKIDCRIGNVSTNGDLVIFDNKDQVQPAVPIAIQTPKPAYTGTSFPNWPFLTHKEALELVHMQASTKGGNDGWSFTTKTS